MAKHVELLKVDREAERRTLHSAASCRYFSSAAQEVRHHAVPKALVIAVLGRPKSLVVLLQELRQLLPAACAAA